MRNPCGLVITKFPIYMALAKHRSEFFGVCSNILVELWNILEICSVQGGRSESHVVGGYDLIN